MDLKAIWGWLFSSGSLRYNVSSNGGSLDNYFFVSQASIRLAATRRAVGEFRLGYQVGLSYVSAIVFSYMDVFGCFYIFGAERASMRFVLGVL